MNYSFANETTPNKITAGAGWTSLFNKVKGNNEAKDALLDSFTKVERAKQEWESTVDSLPELICVVDGNGRIIRVNRTIEVWGLGSVTNVAGRDLHSLIHPACAQPCPIETFLMQIRQEASANSVIETETEIHDPILQRFIQMSGRPVMMKEATATHWVVILRDITERKEMEQALHRQNGRLATINSINRTVLTAQSPEEVAQAALARVQEIIPFQQAHILLNLPQKRELRVLATADNGIAHFLQPGHELPYSEFHSQNSKALSHLFLIDKLSDLPTFTPVEQRWRQQNIQAYINFPLVMGDNLIGTFQIAGGDSSGFKPEDTIVLREVAETLTIAINQSQLYQKLEQSNKELQELLRAKHEMMQNVSHDLRSPLALIKGYTELLQDGLFGALTAEQQEALTILDANGDQLFFLIDRLFKLQTVDKHTLVKGSVDLENLLGQAIQSWQVLAANKSVCLQLDIPTELPSLSADSNMLNQVVFNLLDNALKYSPKESAITIQAQTQDNNIVVMVADEGEGISTDKLKDIFDRFYQTDKGTEKAQTGAGIGLALCKVIVNAHDGRIWAESDGEGHGSAFYFSLPIDT
ncbi:MAG: PAS domain-containing protein [Chloroflexi bacterium]|nr:PAS domain-containing protein [Chloroflexota bacterium]